MKRRRFLQALGAIAASSSVPLPNSPYPNALERALDLLVAELQTQVEQGLFDAKLEYYTLVMHPQQVLDLQRLEARWRWDEAWHRYRKLRRVGLASPDITPRQILEHYDDAPQWEQGTITRQGVIEKARLK